MARERGPSRRDSLGEPADEVQITFVAGAPGPTLANRLRRVWSRVRRRVALALVVAVALAGAVLVASALLNALRGAPSGARAPGAAGVAAAYRYPLACLSVTISSVDRRYAVARLDRASPCWRYGAYATVIFHRVDGAWRLAPGNGARSCPLPSLPAAVGQQLGVCLHHARAVRLPQFYSGSPYEAG